MSESIHAPVTQPDLTRKFPLTDMPTGLMAAGSRGLLITS
jgi:hypothetical protein